MFECLTYRFLVWLAHLWGAISKIILVCCFGSCDSSGFRLAGLAPGIKISFISKIFGFQVFLIVFFVLFLFRFISLALLGSADKGSLGIYPELRLFLILISLVPGLYAMYSVKRYFGLKRAAGGDHFEVKYQTMALATKGIFQFTSNGMYVYAFLLFWAIAVYFSSIMALIVALFSHIYIWVHFYCTERPDMEYIYGAS